MKRYNTPKQITALLCLAVMVVSAGCQAGSHGRGRIGGGFSSDLLPNIVAVVFNDSSVSRVTQEELKYAQAELARGFEHSRLFIAETGAENAGQIARMLEISPDVVHYIYKREAERSSKLMRSDNITGFGNKHLKNMKMYDVIGNQAGVIARQKARVTRLHLQIAKAQNDADLSKSQAMLNVFNSIYVNGEAYGGKSAISNRGVSYYGDAYVYQRLGEVLELTQGAGTNRTGNLANTTAILEAQAAKAVIGGLYKEFLAMSGTSIEHLINPSEQAVLNARTKVMEAELAMSSNASERGAGRVLWERWSTYLDLIELSLECDRIVQKALLNNIRSAETADRIYNEKVKNVLGKAVSSQGAAYFNF